MDINLYQGSFIAINTLLSIFLVVQAHSILKNIKVSFTDALFIVVFTNLIIYGAVKTFFAFSNDGFVIARYTIGICQPASDGLVNPDDECIQHMRTILTID